MNNKTKTRSLKVAIIAIALLLCFALAVGVTSALYQARRQATGTLSMDKGIVIDYQGFNKGDENIWQRETTTSFKLFEETNAQPGQEISVYPSGIRANVDSINFYARLKLEYIFYNVVNGVETQVDLANPKSLIKTSSDFFASKWVASTDGYYYFGEGTTLNQFSKDNQNFENLFADNAKFLIEGENFIGETAGEGGGFVVNGTAINKIVVYLTLETLQGDADPAAEGWKISQSTDKTVDISTLPEDKTDITIDDIIDEDNKNGEITITGDPKQPLTITIGSKAFYGCSKLKLTLSNSENIVYQIATDAFTSGATIMYGLDNVSSKLINPSTSGHTTVGFEGKWQVSAPGLYLFLPSPITPTTSSYGDFQYTDDQGTWYFDLIDESGNKVDASTLSSLMSTNSVSTLGATTLDSTDNYSAKLNKFEPKDGVTTVVIPKYLGISEDSNKFAVTKINGYYTMSSGSRGAFESCRSLVSIIIPDSVTSIGDSAFSGCSGLTTITIPNSVTSIGDSAFSGCSGLTTITIPNSVTSIGGSAFRNCSGLTSIIVDKGNSVYHSAGNCLIETANKTLLTGCKNSVIPTDGSVTSIGDYAFQNCSGLTSVTIPDSVTSIGVWTFYGCSGLTTITIPDSVISIGVYAFASCRGLTSITIPDSVTSIGNYAFERCSGLTSITIPDSVTSIGKGVFWECSGLTSVHIGAGIKEVSWPDDGKFGYVSFLNSDASLNEITISKNNPYLFSDGKLIYKKLGNNQLQLERSFTNGINYEIPNEIIINGEKHIVTSIKDFAFYGRSSLTTITIPDSVTSIGDYAFHSCRKLTSIIIPDSVTSIGDWVFWECRGLTSVHIGAGISEVSWLPDNVSSMTITISESNPYLATDSKAIFTKSNSELTLAKYFSADTTYEIPAKLNGLSVTSIGNSAFYSCRGLTSITIPDSVTSIGGSAFSNCSGLTSVTIGNSVTSIGNYAFEKCGKLTSITIPDSVTSIGNRAFYGCDAITSVTIGNGVTSIGGDAFAYCSGLTSIIIPGSLTSIGGDAFAYCSGLTSIIIPGSLTSIGGYAFQDCSALTSIVLLEGIKEIPYGCFSGCTSLESVTIPSTCTTIGDSAFYNCTNLTTVIWNISYDLGGVNATGPELSSYTGSQTSGLTMDDIIKSAPTNVESGFTFEGWSDGTNIYQPGDKITFGLANRRLTAVWSGYRVTFDANGGTGSVDAQVVSEGSSITLPSLAGFTKEDSIAIGWSTNKNATYAHYLEGESFTPTSNVTLYVVWDRIYSDVTTGETNLKFDLNGGDGKITFEGIYNSGDYVILPEITGVTREGYKFTGWKYRYSGRDQFAQPGERLFVTGSYFDPSYPIIAQWRELVTVTLVFNDGVNDDVILREIDGVTEINFDTYSAKVVAPEGKYFYGWKTANGYYGGTDNISYFANGTTFTAYFKNYETFTLNPNGGDGDAVTFTRSKTNNILDLSKYQITRDGYVLLGWNTDPDSTGIDYKYDEIIEGSFGYPEDDENVILYAVWDQLTNDVTTGYTNIKFDLNGGTGKLVFSGAYHVGEMFNFPDIDGVVKEGYVFLGWSWDSTATSASYLPGSSMNYSHSNCYYAVWKDGITINFDLDGGEGELPSPLTTCYGGTLTINTGKNFTKEGYKFAGWILVDENGNQQTTYGYNTTTTFYYNGSSYTLKAKWSEPQTITFYNDDTKSQSFTMTGFFDTDGITFPDGRELTKEGYYLVGWSGSANSTYVNYSVGDNYSNFSRYTELYAVWKTESECAKIVFDLSEIEGQENIIKIGYSGSFVISDALKSIIENVRNASGQAIAGWAYSQGSSSIDRSNNSWIYYSNYTGQTKTLYPVWKNVLTISFDLNGGEGSLPESFEVWDQKYFDIPEVSLTKEGYLFAGWAWRSNSTYTDYDNGDTNRTFYEDDTYGSTTLYAVWKQPLTLSFDANGGTGDVPEDIITFTEGRINIPKVNLTKDGYKFLGWSFIKNPTWRGIDYEGNGCEDCGYYQYSSKTLYAVWGNTVTYVFDLNGGTGTTPASISANYGERISVPSGTGLEKAGYKFKGWSRNQNSTNDYDWSSGTDFSRGIAGTITMYAVWEVLTDRVFVGSLSQAEIDAVRALWEGHTSLSELTDTSLLSSMSSDNVHSKFTVMAYLNNASLEYSTNGNSSYGIGWSTRYYKLSTNTYTFEFENTLPTGWLLVNWRYEVQASGDVTIVNGKAQATIDYTYSALNENGSPDNLMIIFVLPDQPAASESVSVSIGNLPGNALEALLSENASESLSYFMFSGIKIEIYDSENNLLWLGNPNSQNQGFVTYRFATATYKLRIYTTNVTGIGIYDMDQMSEVTGLDISAVTQGDGYSEFTINYTFAEGNPNLAIFFKMADIADVTKTGSMDIQKEFCGPQNVVGTWFNGLLSLMGLDYTDMSDADKNYAGYYGMLLQEYFNFSICKIPSFSIYTAEGKIFENIEEFALAFDTEYTIKFTEEVKEIKILGNDSMSINSITDITYNSETGTWDATFTLNEGSVLMFLTADLDLSQYEDLPEYDATKDYTEYLNVGS